MLYNIKHVQKKYIVTATFGTENSHVLYFLNCVWMCKHVPWSQKCLADTISWENGKVEGISYKEGENIKDD